MVGQSIARRPIDMDKIRNIAFYENLLDPSRGGVQRVTHTLAKEFTRRGVNVFVIHCDRDGFTDKETFQETFYYTGDKFALKHFCEEKNIDVVIHQLARQTNSINDFYEIKESLHFKFIVALHTSPNCTVESCRYKNIAYPKDFIRACAKQLITFFYRVDVAEMKNAYVKSDKFVLLSSSFIEPTKKLLHVDGGKLCAIGNPLTYDMDLQSVPQKKKEILVVSRMNENPKRISKVLSAWKTLQHRLPDWELYLVGEGNRLSTYIERAKVMNLERIHFEGRKDPLPYYKRAAIFLMTSVFEGFGMTLTESQELGVVPIVYDTATCFHDILTDKVNGCLIPEGKTREFTEAIYELAVNEMARESYATNGLRSVRQFSVTSIVEHWFDLMKTL